MKKIAVNGSTKPEKERAAFKNIRGDMFKEMFFLILDSPFGVVLQVMFAISISLPIVNFVAMAYLKWKDPERYNRLMINITRNSMGLPDLWEPPKSKKN